MNCGAKLVAAGNTNLIKTLQSYHEVYTTCSQQYPGKAVTVQLSCTRLLPVVRKNANHNLHAPSRFTFQTYSCTADTSSPAAVVLPSVDSAVTAVPWFTASAAGFPWARLTCMSKLLALMPAALPQMLHTLASGLARGSSFLHMLAAPCNSRSSVISWFMKPALGLASGLTDLELAHQHAGICTSRFIAYATKEICMHKLEQLTLGSPKGGCNEAGRQCILVCLPE